MTKDAMKMMAMSHSEDLDVELEKMKLTLHCRKLIHAEMMKMQNPMQQHAAQTQVSHHEPLEYPLGRGPNQTG